MSALEWSKMDRTAEAKLGKRELQERSSQNTLEELSASYTRQADEILAGKDSVVAKDEISRFAKLISGSNGTEQYEQLARLVGALRMRRSSFFDSVPDDEHEQAAFALALVRRYERTLQ